MLSIGSRYPRKERFQFAATHSAQSIRGTGLGEQRLEGGKHPFQLRGEFRFQFHVCSCRGDLFRQRGEAPANHGDIRTSSSASADSSSRRPGSSARSHRCGIAASPYRAPAIAPAMDPVVSASPPRFTVFTTQSSNVSVEKKASNTVRSVSTTVGGRICHHTPRSGTPDAARPILPPPPAGPAACCAEKSPVDHLSHRYARRVRQRVMVGDTRLLDREAGEELLVPEGVEGDRRDTHRRAVSRPALVGGGFQPSLFHVLLDPATAGGPHVGGVPRQPSDEPVRDRPEIPPSRSDDSPGDAKRHLRVVGDLSRRQLQPAPADDLPEDAVPAPDLGRRHEFGRGPQCVSHGDAEQRRPRTVDDPGRAGRRFPLRAQ